MRIETNTKLAKRNRQLATYLFLGTFGLLIAGFLGVNLVLFNPEAGIPETLLFGLQITILPIFFIVTVISVRMTNLWVRKPYPEIVISEGLKGLSNKSVLYSYYHFPARHVLICPQGVFAIVTRWHDGEYTVQGDQWRTHRSAIGRVLSLFRFDGVGNPTVDALRARNHLKKLLQPIAPEVEVEPLIVFVDPRARLHIENPLVPVVHADSKLKPNLRDFLRDKQREVSEPSTQTGKKKNAPKAVLPLTDEQIHQFEKATLR